MSKPRTIRLTSQPGHSRTTYLPGDLAKPADPERASFIANCVVAGALGLGVIALFVYALTAPIW